MWRRFLRWLQEPIPFPGMTFDIDCHETRYNQEKVQDPKSPRNADERRPPQPR
jgi:hypothetical protein